MTDNNSGVNILKKTSKMHKAMNIECMGECPLETFELGARKWRKGVITGVPLSVKMEDIMNCFDEFCEAKRLTRFREGVREETTTVCLKFQGDTLPDRVYQYSVY